MHSNRVLATAASSTGIPQAVRYESCRTTDLAALACCLTICSSHSLQWLIPAIICYNFVGSLQQSSVAASLARAATHQITDHRSHQMANCRSHQIRAFSSSEHPLQPHRLIAASICCSLRLRHSSAEASLAHCSWCQLQPRWTINWFELFKHQCARRRGILSVASVG